MAKNKVKDRIQFYNSKTKLWCKYNTETKKIMSTKDTKFKGVRVKKKS